jgi:hypothetical protein
MPELSHVPAERPPYFFIIHLRLRTGVGQISSGTLLPHKCGVPPGYGTPHLCGSEELYRAPDPEAKCK